MIKLIGEKVLLREATQKDINELYCWKYEENNQEAKKMESPLYTRRKTHERRIYEFMG